MNLKFRDERIAAVFLLKLGEVEQDGIREILELKYLSSKLMLLWAEFETKLANDN